MTYKGRVYPHPFQVFPNDQFISVVITSFCRPFYIKRAIDTLAKYADMPYELIVHDDGSHPASARDELYAMSDKISTIIFNNGTNLGLNESVNRCVSVASSKYIVFATDDCWFERPILQDVKNVLSRPYVGYLSPANDGPITSEPTCKVGNSEFVLTDRLGSGTIQAFRKDMWEEIGGWDVRSTSGQSDNVFLFKMYKAGYWKAVLKGTRKIKCANFDETDTYVPTFDFMRGLDCSLPRLFNFNMEQQILLSHKHREACQYWVDGERTIPDRKSFYDDRDNPVAGLNDIPYWSSYFEEIFSNKGTSYDARDIQWDVAERHGQVKWREEITKDFNLG
jgi:glycosyltransferase involved in cell wall biosynthesis